jgi:heme O synthase-like polyprenyltransferase
MLSVIPHIADVFAIPMFVWLSIYFYKKKQKNKEEIILFLLSVLGLVLDVIFTIYFIISTNY